MSRTKSLPEAFRECHGVVLELTLANFAPHKTGRNGWMPRCRECMRAIKRAWAKAHPKVQVLVALKPGQLCPECFGLAHRVDGANCGRCGLPYAQEPPAELVTHRSYERAV